MSVDFIFLVVDLRYSPDHCLGDSSMGPQETIIP